MTQIFIDQTLANLAIIIFYCSSTESANLSGLVDLVNPDTIAKEVCTNSVSQSVSYSISQYVSQLVSQSVSQSVNQLVSQLIIHKFGI